jgi:hypothetical protein
MDSSTNTSFFLYHNEKKLSPEDTIFVLSIYLEIFKLEKFNLGLRLLPGTFNMGTGQNRFEILCTLQRISLIGIPEGT